MWQVIITNKFMKDFVTSHTAVMLFETEDACHAYVASSEKFHPGNFSYRILAYVPEPPRKPRPMHPDDDWWWKTRNRRVQCHGKGDVS